MSLLRAVIIFQKATESSHEDSSLKDLCTMILEKHTNARAFQCKLLPIGVVLAVRTAKGL